MVGMGSSLTNLFLVGFCDIMLCRHLPVIIWYDTKVVGTVGAWNCFFTLPRHPFHCDYVSSLNAVSRMNVQYCFSVIIIFTVTVSQFSVQTEMALKSVFITGCSRGIGLELGT
jgi:hypothetical protein